jgi:hypothetical protein
VRHTYDFDPYAGGMEAMRSTWTDSRLDDLNGRVIEIRDDVRDLRGEMHEEFREVRGEIAGLKGVLIQIGWALAGTVGVGVLGLIGTVLALAWR